MYKISTTKQFRKDYKRLVGSGHFDVKQLNAVINNLAAGKTLNEKHNDHALKGAMKGLRECHVKPDLLLIYKIFKGHLILELVRLGTHSEVLGM